MSTVSTTENIQFTMNGNVQGSATITVTATTKNSVYISASNSSNQPMFITVRGSGSASDSYSVDANQTSSRTSSVPASSSWEITVNSPLSSSSTTFTVNVPNSPPSVSLNVPAQLVVGNNTITVTANDPDGDSMTLSYLRYRTRANSSSSWSDYTNLKSGGSISGTMTVTHTIPSSLMGYEVEYSVSIYDTGYEYATKTATSSVKSNVAPTAPTAFVYPTKIRSETEYTLSWSGAADADGNLSGYKVERTIDGGATWTQIYQGAASSTTDRLDYNQAATVQYRVKAYDSMGAESGWYTAAAKAVVNNRAPTTPASISVPMLIYGGEKVTITWSASSDADGNLSAYVLERSVNGGEWTVVMTANKLSYEDTASTDWATVAYRVKARDAEGDESEYRTSLTRTLENNSAPVITCAVTALGVVTADFTISYSVSDPDGDAITVAEYLDSTLLREYAAVAGQAQTCTVSGMTFMCVSNGGHSVTIKATDARGKSAAHTVTLVKQVYEASVTLTPEQSLTNKLGTKITKAILTVKGEIPSDNFFKVEFTNNAKDATPVWEDATTVVKSGNTYVFTNATVTNENNFAFRLTVKRNGSAKGGYLSYIGGAFE